MLSWRLWRSAPWSYSQSRVRTVFCGTDPTSAAVALSLRSENRLVACGLHPWHADRFTVAELLPFIRESAALGEIGLDCVWTDVDMAIQRRAFVEQLDLAQGLGLPVVLHTKGMEGEIARTIRGCDVPKLVHWYSCGEYLSDYLDQDCYFTVGPDYESNSAVQTLIRRVPLDRLLTETDGLEAVAWALNRPATPDMIEEILRGELEAIARAHGVSPEEAERRVEANLDQFLSRRGATETR